MTASNPQDHIRKGFDGLDNPKPASPQSAWVPATPFETRAPLVDPAEGEITFAASQSAVEGRAQ